MLQTFCYLCIKKPMTLPHTPLRLLKHRTKNTYEPPKARTRRTNHKKNDQKHEPKERPKARTTKRTTRSTNPKNDQKHEPRKERPKSTSQKAQTQPRCFKPASQPRCFKPASQSHKAQQAPLIASLRPRTQSSPYRSHVS